MDLTPEEKQLLRSISTTSFGRDLNRLLIRLRDEATDLDSIDGGDYGAQVEGRKIVKKVLNTIIEQTSSRNTTSRSPQVDGDDEWS